MNEQVKLVNEILDFLSVERQEANLAFLNEMIKNHQLKIKWETLSKVVDWEEGNETGRFLPPIERYFKRIIHQGMGGTCWTHSVGMHWLLTNLGYQVNYMYMDPGHLCLRVDLDQPYYVDVGYCAPLFQAYPIYQSFQVKTEREVFVYKVEENEITITRTPGPTKILRTDVVRIDEMKAHINRSNDWKVSPVLKEIQIFGYIDGVPTSIKNQTLKQHFKTGTSQKELNKKEMEYWLTERFGMDAELYKRALVTYEEYHQGVTS
ncbi:arylamine N-acetyltransferase [Alkalihalobacterium elongatum]|uniref:arylamine N-acetyltransferase n=1 Tax=Alkalihalobacterium elongatum TaxID=2675466 RepID=UPI001C1F8D91|nr:arylamine N-acetyltransferase [Alkalihalobacterium elongatum]